MAKYTANDPDVVAMNPETRSQYDAFLSRYDVDAPSVVRGAFQVATKPTKQWTRGNWILVAIVTVAVCVLAVCATTVAVAWFMLRHRPDAVSAAVASRVAVFVVGMTALATVVLATCGTFTLTAA